MEKGHGDGEQVLLIIRVLLSGSEVWTWYTDIPLDVDVTDNARESEELIVHLSGKIQYKKCSLKRFRITWSLTGQVRERWSYILRNIYSESPIRGAAAIWTADVQRVCVNGCIRQIWTTFGKYIITWINEKFTINEKKLPFNFWCMLILWRHIYLVWRSN